MGNATHSDIDSTKLSSRFTISGYRKLESSLDREGIADYLLERFTERYIEPFRGVKKHGFSLMAISCLMIEALESFRLGWSDTDRKSQKAFESFFQQCSMQGSELGVFAENTADFFKNVRCGILHQAETTSGWRILRKGPLPLRPAFSTA